MSGSMDVGQGEGTAGSSRAFCRFPVILPNSPFAPEIREGAAPSGFPPPQGHVVTGWRIGFPFILNGLKIAFGSIWAEENFCPKIIHSELSTLLAIGL
jgi:hypothetical protein